MYIFKHLLKQVLGDSSENERKMEGLSTNFMEKYEYVFVLRQENA